MRFTFSHFENLPILARIFWKIPKYIPDIPDRQTFNKIISIYSPEFKATCIFTHKTNIDESIFRIKSDFAFISEKYKIEESCNYSKHDMNEKFRIHYSFIEKQQEEQMFIYEKELGSLPVNLQNLIKDVENLLEKNKEKCVIS